MNNLMPTESASLAQTPKGAIVKLGGKFWTVGQRPRPGFVILHRQDGVGETEEYEEAVVRLRTRVSRLVSGKVVQV